MIKHTVSRSRRLLFSFRNYYYYRSRSDYNIVIIVLIAMYIIYICILTCNVCFRYNRKRSSASAQNTNRFESRVRCVKKKKREHARFSIVLCATVFENVVNKHRSRLEIQFGEYRLFQTPKRCTKIRFKNFYFIPVNARILLEHKLRVGKSNAASPCGTRIGLKIDARQNLSTLVRHRFGFIKGFAALGNVK